MKSSWHKTSKMNERHEAKDSRSPKLCCSLKKKKNPYSTENTVENQRQRTFQKQPDERPRWSSG